MNTITKRKKIIKALTKVIDPELHINIIDLGLIYNVNISQDNYVNIDLTLTTPGCPLSEYFISEIENVLLNLSFINDLNVNLVWDPPWDITMIDEKAKQDLFNNMRN